MSVFKNLTTAIFLGAATVSTAVVIPQASYAATVGSVEAIITARIAQLQAEKDAFDAIVNDGSQSTTVRNQAQADAQIVIFRILQLEAILGIVPNFAGNPAILASLENFFQQQVSNA